MHWGRKRGIGVRRFLVFFKICFLNPVTFLTYSSFSIIYIYTSPPPPTPFLPKQLTLDHTDLQLNFFVRFNSRSNSLSSRVSRRVGGELHDENEFFSFFLSLFPFLFFFFLLFFAKDAEKTITFAWNAHPRPGSFRR